MIFLIPAVLLVLYINTYCQQDSTWNEETAESKMELISDDGNDQAAEYIEDINDVRININTAGIKELSGIPGMLLSDAHKIIDYKKKSGRIFSLFELYAVEGIDAARLRSYFPFLTLEDAGPDKEPADIPLFFTADLRTRVQSDIQSSRGFSQNVYKGNPLKVYSRLRVKDNRYSFGFISEKDPGEKDYADHISFYLHVKDIGIVKSFIAGDYNIEFGKGLALWSNYGMIRKSQTASGFRHGRNLVPYLSSNEVHYFRGTAMNLEYKSIELTGFYSNKYIDADIDPVSNTVNSLPADGYHRTDNELSGKQSLKEIISGARLDLHSGNFSAGVLYYTVHNNLAFDETKLPGRHGLNYLVFSASWSTERALAETEIARSRGSTAWLASLRFDITEKITAFLITENSPREYYSRPGAVNRTGTYAGISMGSIPGSLIFSFDSYKKFLTSSPFPVSCSDMITDYSINPSEDILLRFRHKYKKENTSSVNKNYSVYSNNVTGEAVFKISRNIKWKWRADFSFVSVPSDQITEKGYAFFQEASYQLFEKMIEIYGRITLFKTDSYNTRIYQYEKSPAGVFIMNPLMDEGLYWYLGANLIFSKGLRLHCRFNEMYKPAAESLGSGYNEINGSVHNQLLFQLDFRL